MHRNKARLVGGLSFRSSTFSMPASPPFVGATLTFLGEVSGSVFMMFAYKILVTLALSSFENCRARDRHARGAARGMAAGWLTCLVESI